MPNPYFKFKQFKVYHDQCAMKVGTDGVLVGSWANKSGDIIPKQILDVGAGSGLISLMLAQRFRNAEICSIEIEAEATNQANKNYTQSSFQNIQPCINISLQDLTTKTTQKFDLIVSNPPFFSNSLKSPDNKRTQARHTDSLLVEDFIEHSAQLLQPDGELCFIFPASEMGNIIEIANKNKLYANNITTVYSTPTSLPKRILISLSLLRKEAKRESLILETERHKLSPEFYNLVKDFYLNL